MRRFWIVLFLLPFSCIVGCAGEGWQGPWTKAKPETVVDLGPFHLSNSKDVVIKAKDVEIETPKGTRVKVGEFYLADSATAVRQADAQQTEAITNLTRAIGEPIIEGFRVAGAVLPAYAPPKKPDVSVRDLPTVPPVNGAIIKGSVTP